MNTRERVAVANTFGLYGHPAPDASKPLFAPRAYRPYVVNANTFGLHVCMGHPAPDASKPLFAPRAYRPCVVNANTFGLHASRPHYAPSAYRS